MADEIIPITSNREPWWKNHDFWSKNIVQLVVLAGGAYEAYSGRGLTPEQQTSVLKTAGTLLTSIEAAYHFARSLKTKGGSQ